MITKTISFFIYSDVNLNWVYNQVNNIYNHLLYFSYWVVNAFVISFFHYLYPTDFVLGTAKLTALDASIYSGFWLTFVVWIFWDYLLARELQWGSGKVFFWFWIANTIGIWITARLSNFTGFGISYFYLAILLGLFTNILQRLIRKFVVKKI